ncbi:hypothetical protein [Bifidobacterium crudilactis]|uniref:hypothetical protein n=1 Tax=Bifidobacterium crudilactis TaxID=327277 RepID=UPI002647906E|nr:hypothetical protein [Bifidobacterium crudilactis]MDN5973408.1 hypothetical protein [Bifidobacterium crudilactis]MDN6001589.1 hypothetical protein [Bifidobacterium crudilactis]MDN6209998.1 hypothetical protein [Bifidobacterium crudilactis]MDN6468149.1 hypothetical protein [Bifidobacterium crudilactis]MDN6521689.1 hypothetical protein [Bifidobacterium crudilactis]
MTQRINQKPPAGDDTRQHRLAILASDKNNYATETIRPVRHQLQRMLQQPLLPRAQLNTENRSSKVDYLKTKARFRRKLS